MRAHFSLPIKKAISITLRLWKKVLVFFKALYVNRYPLSLWNSSFDIQYSKKCRMSNAEWRMTKENAAVGYCAD